MTDTLTYVYCLVHSARRPLVRGTPAGMPDGGDVRPLDAGDGVWLIVSSVPARAYGEAEIARGLQQMEWVSRRALAHEAVVERFLSARALLPMQMFTLFTSDARASAFVSDHRARIDALLARLARQREWGLRVGVDDLALPKMSAPAGRADLRLRSGAEYLARKRDVLQGARRRLQDAAAAADRLYRILSREATASRRRSTDAEEAGSRLLLDAAFLVASNRTGAFRASVRREERVLRAAGLVVTLTGPWPPYNFIDAPVRPARRARPTAAGSSSRRRHGSAAGGARRAPALAKRR